MSLLADWLPLSFEIKEIIESIRTRLLQPLHLQILMSLHELSKLLAATLKATNRSIQSIATNINIPTNASSLAQDSFHRLLRFFHAISLHASCLHPYVLFIKSKVDIVVKQLILNEYVNKVAKQCRQVAEYLKGSDVLVFAA